MSFTTHLNRALSDFKQNFLTQFMTTMVVALSMLIFSFFSLLYWNLQNFVEKFGSELGIVVFLKNDVAKEQIPILFEKLSNKKGVERVFFISSREAFKQLEKFLGKDKDILKGVDPDFLPPSFEIKVDRAVFQIERIRNLAAELSQWPEVSKVQFGQEWIDRLELFSDAVRAIVAVSGILLLITVSFVVSNTIKLTVYARQEELEIMRLVGATNAFIKGPVILEAIMQGLVGSFLAICGVLFCYGFLKEMVSQSELLRGVEVVFLPLPFIGSMVLSSIFLCVAGTALAMRRFLRL